MRKLSVAQNGGGKEGKVKKGEAGEGGGWYEQCQGKRRKFLQVQSGVARLHRERNGLRKSCAMATDTDIDLRKRSRP